MTIISHGYTIGFFISSWYLTNKITIPVQSSYLRGLCL